MRMLLISLGAGVLVGVIYGLLNVRSPAPPIVALAGLLGILGGEQVVPIVKRLMVSAPVTLTWIKHECMPQIFGELPRSSSQSTSSRVASTGRNPGGDFQS